mgnify:CR=1 FL=1
MSLPFLRTGLAAIVALGGAAAFAQAQSPPAAVPHTPQIIKWPGGYMVMNGSEVIVRSTGPGGSSTNLVTGSGNGFGNKIVVSGGAGGVTIVQNARNGIGNRLIVDPDDLFIDIDELLGIVKPRCVKPAVPAIPVAPAPLPVLPPPVEVK